MVDNIKIGEYYLIKEKNSENGEIFMVKIISQSPQGYFFILDNGKKRWVKLCRNWDDAFTHDLYTLEHLPQEFVTQLLREQKLERIEKN